MAGNLPGWTPDTERGFKEVLFRFLEEVHSTKAALYLLAPDGSFVLVTQYGFGRRDVLASEHRLQDPMVALARDQRVAPRAYNDPREIPDLAPYLEGAGTARLLLVPLTAGSRLLGLVDARDKGRKRAFDEHDRTLAAAIGSSLLELIRQVGLYADLGAVTADAEGEPGDHVKVEGIEPHGAGDNAGVVLDLPALESVLTEAADLVSLCGMIGVAVTVTSGTHGAVTVCTGDTAEGLDPAAIVRHQAEALRQGGRREVDTDAWQVRIRRLTCVVPPATSSVIATRVLLEEPDWAMIGSIIAAAGSERQREAMGRLGTSAHSAREVAALRFARRSLARRLLRPGGRVYVELEAHSEAVSRWCWAIAHAIGLDTKAAETAAVAGLLHDVGMRELDYDTLYRHPSPGPDERRRYQQHVVIGGSLLDEAGIDEVAAVARHHHERWDGNGYPGRLRGEGIPLLARLVHVAEVYDVLTSSQSYRRPVAADRALAILRAGAGHQFDADMVEVMARIVG